MTKNGWENKIFIKKVSNNVVYTAHMHIYVYPWSENLGVVTLFVNLEAVEEG